MNSRMRRCLIWYRGEETPQWNATLAHTPWPYDYDSSDEQDDDSAQDLGPLKLMRRMNITPKGLPFLQERLPHANGMHTG